MKRLDPVNRYHRQLNAGLHKVGFLPCTYHEAAALMAQGWSVRRAVTRLVREHYSYGGAY